jgi:hypothetical protein
VDFDKDALAAATSEDGVAGHATGGRSRRLQSDIEYRLQIVVQIHEESVN